ncbi:unnamed protein product, partial [Urochloa humidicola]
LLARAHLHHSGKSGQSRWICSSPAGAKGIRARSPLPPPRRVQPARATTWEGGRARTSAGSGVRVARDDPAAMASRVKKDERYEQIIR